MSLKKLLLYLGSWIATGFLAFAVSFVYARYARATEANAPARPFVAEITKKMYSPTRELTQIFTTKYERFADRSTITDVTQTYPDSNQLVVDVSNMSTGRRIFLDPLTMSGSTIAYTPDVLRRMVVNTDFESCPATDISALPDGGEYLGYPTVHFVEHMTPVWTQERWMVKSLNCFSVRTIDTHVSGAYNEETVDSLVEGEPPDSLSLPPGYTERSPKEAEALHEAAAGGAAFLGKQLAKRLDREYHRGSMPRF